MPERRAVPVRDFAECEIDMIAVSTIAEGTPYDLNDVPENDLDTGQSEADRAE